MKTVGQLLLVAAAVALPSEAFQPAITTRRVASALRSEEQWTGEVVNNEDGRIKGCTITPVSDTEFSIQIDGVEADLGAFSNVVYRKITSDAKQQNFQGFRPGTLPPHLLPTYKTFAMDEVAREATLEAMQQNNIKPFESGRLEMSIEQVSIPSKPKKKKKKKGGRKKKANAEPQVEVVDDAPPAWETYDTMKEAIKAGWEPGQSFSFVAKNCRGQKVDPVSMERPPVI
mmetsp:Transcript_2155/g.3972  ORF Transcript_2155/g.3972 Transcript_2155/m.3972 type:complete len:229 (+) Transcript_2155:54-740(+)|eukprot:CAMPEP_0183703802 /NCGR_PEP_ID=MMETSP0737-20130205/1401_1 /TAXON_ID=385413 /ORGANISM="Thalassiosira miniscula, Strain CCMP1093" /LENGTH=228 /DNA_ID=CAMNT_0025930599 /DNA_START=54 /DNA_END=740 /DNA_ORIENTATION=+